jgi:4-carboxymuconolactone decarboxylase
LARIPFPSPETMTPEQRRVYDAVVAGPRGVVVGPLRAALHSPELAERWQRLGEYLRYDMCVPARLRELAILVTARRWNSQLEWLIHEEAARKAGLAESIIAAIHRGESPQFADEDEAAVYEYARELQERGQVSEPLYRRVAERWQALGVVELTALIGYYTMVSMTLNAHEIPLPEGRQPPLDPLGEGLSSLAAGRSK